MSDSPVSHHKSGPPSESPDADASNEQRAQMEQAYQQMQRKMRISKMDESIKHKIMVLSGKGGVGKSTVATGLALSLARQGKKVGLMDIDITGPNVPKMLGLEQADLNVEEGQIHPADGPSGLNGISIKLGAIQQFIGDVTWGELDTLIIDFPPVTSDEPLTVSQSLPGIDGVVIVTTPQEVALLDSRKSINFAKTISVPVLGVVENMRGYTLRGTSTPNSKISVMGPGGVPIECHSDEDGNWDMTLDVFKSGGGEEASKEMGVPFLGSLPFDPGIVRGGDDGVHRIIAEPEGETARAFETIVESVLEQLDQGSQRTLRII